MVAFDRTKGCCFCSELSLPSHDQFAELDAHNCFITGSLLDYALPTASVIPDLETLHQQTPSPVTPLGTKGVAEGHSMSTPVRIANAVADALGVAEAIVPLTPERVLQMVRHRGQ